VRDIAAGGEDLLDDVTTASPWSERRGAARVGVVLRPDIDSSPVVYNLVYIGS